MTRAYVLRIAASSERDLPACVGSGLVVIGWPEAKGLVQIQDWLQFREIVHQSYFASEEGRRKAGAAGGHLFRFIHQVAIGDLLVVPAPNRQFYVAMVEGPVVAVGQNDIGYQRRVTWLNDGKPIERQLARAALQSRMKVYGTTADASDLVEDIAEVLGLAKSLRSGEMPAFEMDVRRQILGGVLDQLRNGRLDSYKFERFVQLVLSSMGATATITPRALDKGDDIVAKLHPLGGLFEMTLVVQVKHYSRIDEALQPEVLGQLLDGMKAQSATLGAVVTVGIISEETHARANELADEGYTIVLIDGEQLSELYLNWCVGVRGEAGRELV